MLAARFDNRALQPFEMTPGGPAAAAWPALQAWCLARPALPLAVAVAAPEAQPTAWPCAAAWALHLDGSHALLACSGPLARLRLRLQVKWQDLAGAGSLSNASIWDSGRTRGDAAALAQFQPRRPSFIVVDEGPAAAMSAALLALQARSAAFAWPVRVLWLLPGGPGGELAGSLRADAVVLAGPFRPDQRSGAGRAALPGAPAGP